MLRPVTTPAHRACVRAAALLFGIWLTSSPASAQINTEAGLRDAILAANDAGSGTITLLGPITLTGSLPPIQSNITFVGSSFSIDAANLGRVFTIVEGTVTIANLTILNARTVGGAGGAGSFPGGGGAAVGAAIFVGNGATLTTTNVAIQNASAQGGNGGAVTASGGGGGGGGFTHRAGPLSVWVAAVVAVSPAPAGTAARAVAAAAAVVCSGRSGLIFSAPRAVPGRRAAAVAVAAGLLEAAATRWPASAAARAVATQWPACLRPQLLPGPAGAPRAATAATLGFPASWVQTTAVAAVAALTRLAGRERATAVVAAAVRTPCRSTIIPCSRRVVPRDRCRAAAVLVHLVLAPAGPSSGAGAAAG